MATINPSNQQITNHSLIVGSTNNNITNISVAATGTILTGATSSDPVFTASPTIGTTSTSALLTIASNAQTCFAIDNGVSRATTTLIDLYHDASTVANDFVYEIDYNAQNSSNAKKTYVSEQAQVLVNTAGSEMGQFLINTINAGSLQNNITVGNNIGQYRGTQTNTAPPAGFLGEQLSSAVTAVALSTTVAKSLTSITLTPGSWNVNAVVVLNSTTEGISFGRIGVGTTDGSFTGTNPGSTQITFNIPTLANRLPLALVSIRLNLSSNTTYYLIAQANGTGTLTGDGRISATRSG